MSMMFGAVVSGNRTYTASVKAKRPIQGPFLLGTTVAD